MKTDQRVLALFLGSATFFAKKTKAVGFCGSDPQTFYNGEKCTFCPVFTRA